MAGKDGERERRASVEGCPGVSLLTAAGRRCETQGTLLPEATLLTIHPVENTEIRVSRTTHLFQNYWYLRDLRPAKRPVRARWGAPKARDRWLGLQSVRWIEAVIRPDHLITAHDIRPLRSIKPLCLSFDTTRVTERCIAASEAPAHPGKRVSLFLHE